MAHSHNERRETASESGVLNQTRRRVLKTAAAGSALAIAGLPTSAQAAAFELGGVTAGWEGRAPESIAGETNPTLELQAGQTYVIEWENVDGLPHNVVIEDAEGSNIVRSEIISEEGATQTVEFEATSEMAEYYCEVHPQSMRGEVAIGETQEASSGSQQTQGTPRFFEQGPEVGVSSVVEGMTAPTDFAMDEDGRMFVTDQTGELWIVGDGADVGTGDGQNGGGQGGVGENATAPNATVPDDTGSNATTQNDTAQNDTGQNDTAQDTDGQENTGQGDDAPLQVGDEPAIDLSDQMVAVGEEFNGSYADPEQEYDERGLLGVELHPEFADNGRLFLHYSAPPNDETPEGWSHVEVVSEFGMADDGESVDAESEQVLLEFQKPQYNHDSGPMAFGPDGYLLVPMGDGGGANDDMYGHVDDWYAENAGGNGQDTTENLLGGIHRIDVDAEADSGQDGTSYGIPDDNPLVDSEDDRDEYYSWGWRNPFGITVDSQDRIIAADAGQNLFEEANLVEAGGNYGWNVKEGTHCFSTENPGVPPESCPEQVDDSLPAPRGGEELIDPVVEYPHSYQGTAVGIVIAGGHVYEADEIPELQGAYVFGDWTRDVERAAPDGRLFVAWPGSTGDGSDDDGAMDDGQATQDGENATDGAGMQNGTDTSTAQNATQNATQADTNDTTPQTDTNDTTAQNDTVGATQNDTNATMPQDGTGQTEGDEQVVPRDELWEMEELVIAGGEGGNLHRFVRQFGQGQDGEVFVLVSQRGIPAGDTGAVLELVPPGEGDQIQAPEMPEGED